MKDEGIVQPVSKEMEWLSRRLHHLVASPVVSGEATHLPARHGHAMTQARTTSTLTPENAAYIAGLIDGEGTVTLTRHHAGENRRLVISIANTELPMLRFVDAAVGTGKITRKRTSSNHHTPSFCYAVSSRQALALLRQVAPYLRSYKRQRAQLILAQYSVLTPRNGKYSAEMLASRARFEQQLLDLTSRTA
jgi:hypothetical protein